MSQIKNEIPCFVYILIGMSGRGDLLKDTVNILLKRLYRFNKNTFLNQLDVNKIIHLICVKKYYNN